MSTAALALVFALALPTQTPEDSVSVKNTLRVAVAGSLPFVDGAKTPPEGFSVALYSELARRLERASTFKVYPSVADAISAVEKGEADVGVGPFSITADRAQRVDFSQPYYIANIGILTPREAPPIWGRIAPFVSQAFLVGLSILMIILLGVGAIVWLAERGKNEEFPSAPMPGIAAGMWFALVTMTTVGYGDKSPITVLGRLVSAVWMVIAMITASSLTASIATALTLAQIDGALVSSLEDVDGKPVAVIAETPGAAIARAENAKVVVVKTKEAAADLVKKGEVVAFLYDHPVLKAMIAGQEDQLRVVKSRRRAEDYGFALPRNSPLLDAVNIEVLKMGEGRVTAALIEKWLGEAE